MGGVPPHAQPHEWVDQPAPDTQRAIDDAHEDVAAGRSVICLSDAAFDALLDQLAAQSHPKSQSIIDRLT